jgi:hypothetical protein
MEGAREGKKRGGGGDVGHAENADGTMDADRMLLLPDLNARFMFIALPSINALRERLTKCGTESSEG